MAVLAVMARGIGTSSLLFTATSRMPMVAGRDPLIASWFSKLHARHGRRSTRCCSCVVLSVLPIVSVEGWLAIGLEVGGTVIAVNVIGTLMYLSRRSRAGAAAARVAWAIV